MKIKVFTVVILLCMLICSNNVFAQLKVKGETSKVIIGPNIKKVKYSNTNITSSYFTIDTKGYELGEYIIKLQDLQDNIVEEFDMLLQ